MRRAVAIAAALVALSGCGGDSSSQSTTAAETETETVYPNIVENPAPPPVPRPPAAPPPPTRTTAQPTTVRITIREGRPVGGVKRTKIKKGARVVLEIRSDVADEVHLHGYDVSRAVKPGRTGLLAFRATIVGVFEVELEERHLPIAELEVRP